MTTEEIRYQFVEVKTVRGAEQRSIAKKQAEGWELVDQQSGTVRTTLRFRRPKPPVPWKMLAGLGAAAVVLFAIIGIGALLEDDDSANQVNAAETVEAQPAETSDPAPDADPAAVAEFDEVLTIDNSRELAALLQEGDYCSPAVARFAATHAGRTIQFDGHIAAMNTHGSYDTRYDILLGARDFNESDGRGPAFQYRDVAPVSDLNLTGPGIPDAIGATDRFRFTAMVDGYEENSCRLLLDPVSTETR